MMSRCFIFALIFIFLRGSTGFQVGNARDFFTAELIHRDSPISPLYNSSKTSSELLREAVTRSLNQIHRFNSSFHLGEKAFQSEVIPDNADYLMKIYIGFKQLLVMANTGDVFTWILCNPCVNSHNQDVPPFALNSDDTYEEIPFDSEECRDLPDTNRGKSYMKLPAEDVCEYTYSYRKKVQTSGILSRAKFHLDSADGKKVSFFLLLFGCSHQIVAKFSSRVQGMAGLGHGDLSLISQLVTEFKIKKIFSYCLLPVNAESSSKIIFGKKEKFIRKEVSIPLTTIKGSPYYYVTLKRVHIGMEITQEMKEPDNMIIDSGTAITFLEPTLFNEVRAIVKRFIDKPIVKTKAFSLCYKEIDMINGVYPNIILDFGPRRMLTLEPKNIFIEYVEGVICMAIGPSEDGISVLGNLAQTNFQVEYDLRKGFISFASADCTLFGK